MSAIFIYRLGTINLMRDFKGISPLISSVLLIAIAVVMAGILFNWGPALTRNQAATVSNKTSQIVECNAPTIEEVYIDFQANVSRVYVRGGQGPSIVTDSRLINIVGDTAPLVNSSDVPFNITSGQLKILQFNVTNKIQTCNNFSQAVITSCLADKFTDRPKCSG